MEEDLHRRNWQTLQGRVSPPARASCYTFTNVSLKMRFGADIPVDLNHGNLAWELCSEKQGLPEMKAEEAVPQGVPPSRVKRHQAVQGHVSRVTSMA